MLPAAAVFGLLSLGGSERPEPADAVANLDALYARRDDAEALAVVERLIAETEPAGAGEYAFFWRAARHHVWRGDGAADSSQKRHHGKAAWDLGERAIKRDPRGVEGHYYAALGVGLYCASVGVFQVLLDGLDKRFTAGLDRVLKMDPFVDRGGPLLAMGRYYYELPWPLRDLDKSVAHYQRVLEKFPGNLRARLFLAESQLAAGDALAAKATLAAVSTGSREYDPPEARRVLQLVEAVEPRIAAELE